MAPRNDKTVRIVDERETLRIQLQSRSVLLFVTLASIGDAVITTDNDGKISFLNPMAESMTGWDLTEAIGVDITEVFNVVNDRTRNPIENPVRRALDTLSKVHLESDSLLVKKDGSVLPIDDSAAPILGVENEVLGAVLVFRDITDTKKAEEVIRYRSELDRMVASISTAFVKSSIGEVDSRIDEALGEIGRFFKADRAYVYIFSPDMAVMTCLYEWSAEGIEPLKDVSILSSAVPYWTESILARYHIRISRLSTLPPEAVGERAIIDVRGVKSLLAVPMSQEDRVLGFIGIESDTDERMWPEETVNMLYLVGNVFANTMARREAQRKLEAAREREVDIASRIQQSLLLSPPPVASADFEVAAMTIPSRGIDGDFYDFLLHPDRSLDVIFGDVMGKGVPAALLAAGTKTEFLRSLSHLLVSSPRGTIPQPADIVNSVHGVLTPQLLNLDSFVTLSYTRFNPQTKKITLVDCGNTRMLRCAWTDGHIDSLTGFNMPLGFSPSEVYQDSEYTYGPGDVFLLYSDGVTEARDPSGEFFGIQRVERLVADKRLLSPQLIIEAIREAVTSFVGSSVLLDDLTCVCLKTTPVYLGQPLPASSELEVMSTLGELATIRAFLRGFCAQRYKCDLNQKEFHLLELAVNEVASNIMRHAYKGRSDQRIWIRMCRERDVLRVRLTHNGAPFRNPELVSIPPLDDTREGGFGLYIITQSVDSVEYGQDEMGRQFIELCKHLSGVARGE